MKKILLTVMVLATVVSADFACDHDLNNGMKTFKIAELHAIEGNWELFEFYTDLTKNSWISASVECTGEKRKNAKYGLKKVKRVIAHAQEKGLI